MQLILKIFFLPHLFNLTAILNTFDSSEVFFFFLKKVKIFSSRCYFCMNFEFYFLKFNLHSTNLNEVFAISFSANEIRKGKGVFHLVVLYHI